MNGWIYSQLFLDLILVGMILYLILQLRAERKVQEDKEKSLKQLHENLADRIPQGERIFQKLSSEMEKKERALGNLLVQIEQKEKEWQKFIMVGKVDGRLQKDMGSALDSEKSQKYRLVNQLASQGFSASEIAQKVDLPSGEIELIVNLARGNKA